MDLTGFYWVFFGFIGFLQGSIGFYWVLPGLIMSFQDSTGFLLGFRGFLLDLLVVTMESGDLLDRKENGVS